VEKTLVMYFSDTLGKKVSMSLSEIKDELTEEEISELMDVMVENNQAFATDRPIKTKLSANIVEKTVKEVYKA